MQKQGGEGAPGRGRRQAALRLKREHAIALAVAAVVVVVLFVYLVYLPASNPPTSFSAFRNNFASSPYAGVMVEYTNGTGFSLAVSCATSLIEQVQASPATHRNTSTLYFYVLNSTSCIYTPQGLGAYGSRNYNTTTPSACINMSLQMPTIAINYTPTNGTAITKGRLYVHGNAAYLEQCGVASQITSR